MTKNEKLVFELVEISFRCLDKHTSYFHKSIVDIPIFGQTNNLTNCSSAFDGVYRQNSRPQKMAESKPHCTVILVSTDRLGSCNT
jgi:hypothetical protein